MNSAIFFLGMPSVVALGLLIFYFAKNCSRKSVLAYFAAVVVYGILRAHVLQLVLNEGILFPYLMNFQVARFGAVSLQEVIGWSLAATVSWLLADRLLWRFKIKPAPHRVAFLAAICLSTVSLAVETAAIEAGWWTWTIRQIERPLIGLVPLIGLLDWGFVSFDFLLAYLLFARPASLWSRLIALAFFPLHFFGHSKSLLLPEPLPLDLNDIMHGAIATYVLIRAIGEKGEPALPYPAQVRYRFIPLIAVGIIVASTMAVDLIIGKNPIRSSASLPLIILALVAFVKPFALPIVQRPKNREARPAKGKAGKKEKDRVVVPKADKDQPSLGIFFMRIGIAVAIFMIVYGLRVPFHRKSEQFKAALHSGVSRVNQNDLDGAIREFRKAVSYRPDNAAGHALLGQFLLIKKQYAEARQELEMALSLKPTDRHGLLQISILEMIEKHWDQAAEHARYGMRLYQDSPEFVYIAEKAQNHGKEGNFQIALDRAKRGGSQGINSLATVARMLGDTETVNACRTLIRN
ncbi:tetratricopeptide repeat protein [bacterium]|nr:tetratricopeptide repeat protein [bacterium]